MRLKDKVAIVTGGGTGIGRALSFLLLRKGAKVVIADIDDNGGTKTENMVEDMGENVSFLHTDIACEPAVQYLMAHAVTTYGSVDILSQQCCHFHIWRDSKHHRCRLAESLWVNVIGSPYCVRNVVPIRAEAEGGTIVNIASVSGFIAQPISIPYNASRGAVIQLARCLAMDLASKNIPVNCVCPGAVQPHASEIHRKFAGQVQQTFDAEAANSNFFKRVAQPREIAYTALFFASDESSFMTGAPLVIDGGATAQ